MIKVKYLNKLYDELLDIMQNSHTYKQEVLDKMTGEQRNSKKVKAILDHWDEFDYAPSDDPNIDHKYNRDYLWDKLRDDLPDEVYEGNFESLDTDSDSDSDSDSDGDIDKTNVSNLALAIMRNDIGRLKPNYDYGDKDVTPDDWYSAHNGLKNIKMR